MNISGRIKDHSYIEIHTFFLIRINFVRITEAQISKHWEYPKNHAEEFSTTKQIALQNSKVFQNVRHLPVISNKTDAIECMMYF